MEPNIGWLEIHGEVIGVLMDFSKLLEEQIILILKATVVGLYH